MDARTLWYGALHHGAHTNTQKQQQQNMQTLHEESMSSVWLHGIYQIPEMLRLAQNTCTYSLSCTTQQNVPQFLNKFVCFTFIMLIKTKNLDEDQLSEPNVYACMRRCMVVAVVFYLANMPLQSRETRRTRRIPDRLLTCRRDCRLRWLPPSMTPHPSWWRTWSRQPSHTSPTHTAHTPKKKNTPMPRCKKVAF